MLADTKPHRKLKTYFYDKIFLMDRHRKVVAELALDVAKLYEMKKPFKVFHGSTNSTRIQVFKRDEMIDASGLDQVLRIDPERKITIIEPNVPMDKLVAATLKYGLVPPVVMEFPGITVGGGIQGGAGESSSFKYGCFHEICNSYEMILGDGKVVSCSPQEKRDLFYGTAGTYGTLGVMTAVELQLIPAKKYVTLTYLPVTSFEDAVATLQKVAKASYDYIDGIMFGREHGVIMVGKLSDEKVGKVRRFTRAHDDWFYLHAEKIDKSGNQVTESIPLVDYLFRYDRGGFWVGKYAFEIIGVPFNRFWRVVHDRLLHTRKLYEALQESGISQQTIVQDLAFPQNTVTSFMKYTDASLRIYPLWLCPLRTDITSQFIPSHLKTPLAINIGLWGGLMPSYDEFLRNNHAVEQKVAELGGKKWFYAHAYYREDKFWKIYDKSSYTLLRNKYHAQYLPTIYDKVHVKERHPINTRRGVWRPLFGAAKLRILDGSE